MTNNIHSFDPVINARSKVLILGTLPGAKSLGMKQYYADPRNQFWRIVYGVLGEASIDAEYSDRVQFLLDHEIAIWDMFHVADREGSLDASVKNEAPNDIPELLREYPGIQRIILAGRKAAQSFQTYFPDIVVDTVYVPSSSPTPGRHTKTLHEKIQTWKVALTVE